MIAIIGGIVLGIGVLVFLGKPTEKELEERQKEAMVQETPDPAPPALSEEEQAIQDKIKAKNYSDAQRRREHLLGNLSQTDRQAFEELAQEMRDELEGKNKGKRSSDSGSFCIEIVLIFSGLIFVYGLLVLSGTTLYSPRQIFNIIMTFFVRGPSDSSSSSSSSNGMGGNGSNPFQQPYLNQNDL